LSDLDPELEQFAMDAQRTPQWVLRTHTPDQTADPHPSAASEVRRLPFKVVCKRNEKFRRQPVTPVPLPAEPEPLGFSRHLGAPSPAENDVRQRAVLGAKTGLNRATLDAQKSERSMISLFLAFWLRIRRLGLQIF
jgi:hypothetical protein